MKNIIESGPPYILVANELRKLILSKKIKSGEKLPSYSAISKKYGIAVNTAKAAVKVLSNEDLVIVQHGRGTFVK